jgi:uncharacterized protein
MAHIHEKIVSDIAEVVKQKFEGEGTGHDWWHIYRVWQMARHIGEKEKADMFVVELGALLHDIADWKFHNGDDTVGPHVAGEMLAQHGVAEDIIEKVKQIISEVSFKSAGEAKRPATLEGQVVQDADRLDALGAIGIARTFAYGGYKGRPLYDPAIKPVLHATREERVREKNHTINHFYEKLLLLKDLMNTQTGRELAQERHEYMEEFLKQFYKEWEGEI